MPTIKEILQEKIKTFMKAGDRDAVNSLRMIHSAIRKKEIDDRVDLDDGACIKIIQSLMKQRQEAIEQYQKGQRPDLVEKETRELKMYQEFLPEALSDAELAILVDSALKETGATDLKQIGQVMKWVMERSAGRADGKTIQSLVRSKLQAP